MVDSPRTKTRKVLGSFFFLNSSRLPVVAFSWLAKYFLEALDVDPKDTQVMLKLGWAYNAVKRDDQAKIWFDKARHAEDRQTATEASKAFHNLNGDVMILSSAQIGSRRATDIMFLKAIHPGMA